MFKVSFQSFPVSDFLDLPSSYPLEDYKDPVSFDHPNTVAFYPSKKQKYGLVVDNKTPQTCVLVMLQGDSDASTSIVIHPSTRKWIQFDDTCVSVKLSKFGPGYDSNVIVSKNNITYQFWTF